VDIVVMGRHTEVPERFRQMAEEKLLKVGALAPKVHRVDVELSHERNPRQAAACERIEITVRGKGPVVRAEAAADDVTAAFDLAFGKLLERLRRSRDRVKVHHGRQTPASLRVRQGGDTVADGDDDGAGAGVAMLAEPAELPGGVETEGLVPALEIRAKDHPATPMTVEEAVTAMELVGHDFYLFMDAEDGRPSAVYRRHGWTYGVIRLVVV
jgi:ribosomal subunit interface protein